MNRSTIGQGTSRRELRRPRSAPPLSLIHLQRVLDPLRLRLLLEVEARGSISAAAEACTIGQPSASMHLRTLEGATGHQLIERNGRGSRLTPAGRIVAAHAARVLNDLDGLESELVEFQGGHRPTITVAACTVATYLLPRALRAFGEGHPGIDVDVRFGPSRWVTDSITRREAALGLAGDTAPTDRLRFDVVIEDPVVGIVAPGRADPLVSAEEFGRYTLIVSGEGSSTSAVAEQALSRAGIRSGRTWTMRSTEAIKRSVREGLGVAFMSRLTVLEELERGELATFRVVGVPPTTVRLCLVWGADRELNTAERAFAATVMRASAQSVALASVGEAS
jgi:molybdate transport repressor ModE-like protein